MTSLLDDQLYPPSLFKDLYHQRWGIEENYKIMKSRIEMENFTGKSVHSIYQDFHARIVSMNLAAIVGQPAQEQLDQEPFRKKKNHYQVNFTFALSCLKNNLVRLFLSNTPEELLQKLFFHFCKNPEPIRPGRSFPRKKVIRDHDAHFICYKSPA